MCVHQQQKKTTKKKKKKNQRRISVHQRRKKKKKTQRTGLRAAQVATVAVGGLVLSCISISSSSLSFFSFFTRFFLLFLHFGSLISIFLVRNRVLDTRFPCRCYAKKVLHQTWTTHKNRVPKTRFIDPKSSLLDSKC